MPDLNLLNKKKILITGPEGFIGAHLTNRLRHHLTSRLTLLTRRSHPKGEDGITWMASDLGQLTPDIWREYGVEEIDILFHLGAFTPKDCNSHNEIEKVYQDNLFGTWALLRSLPAVPKRIVFASTLDVYDKLAAGAIIDETFSVNPASLYGASKFFCEQLVKFYAHKNSCEFAILRYGHIFGPGEQAYGKLIPATIRKLLNGEPPVLFDSGSAQRDFLYVDDAVEATLRAAASDARELGPINVVRGASVSIRSVIEMLILITGFSGKIRFLESENNKEHSIRFDNKRMLQSLGVWDFVPLNEGLRREVEYFKELGSNRHLPPRPPDYEGYSGSKVVS